MLFRSQKMTLWNDMGRDMAGCECCLEMVCLQLVFQGGEQEWGDPLTKRAGELTSMWLMTWSSVCTLWSGTAGLSRTAFT